MTQGERICRYQERVLNCHKKIFCIARKLEALGALLEKGFEADGDVAQYGLGMTLNGFGEELSEVYRELDRVAEKLHSYGKILAVSDQAPSFNSGTSFARS
jgi:hypothetical protein